MRILSGPEFEAAVAKEAWAAVVNGRVVIKSAARCYTTDFECGGIVGADMSEILLNEFFAGDIDSGLLQVVAGDPSSRHQGAVINYMLNLMGQESRSIYEFNFQFQAEGLALLAVMSWCLACGWEFDFLATKRRFGVRVERNNELSVFWDERETLTPTTPELLKNLEFVATNNCFSA